MIDYYIDSDFVFRYVWLLTAWNNVKAIKIYNSTQLLTYYANKYKSTEAEIGIVKLSSPLVEINSTIVTNNETDKTKAILSM